MQSRPDRVSGSDSDLATLSVLDLAPQFLPDVTTRALQDYPLQIWHSDLRQIWYPHRFNRVQIGFKNGTSLAKS